LKHFYPKDGKWETTTENELKALKTDINSKVGTYDVSWLMPDGNTPITSTTTDKYSELLAAAKAKKTLYMQLANDYGIIYGFVTISVLGLLVISLIYGTTVSTFSFDDASNGVYPVIYNRYDVAKSEELTNEVTRAKAAEKTLQTNIDTKIDLNSGVTTNRPTDKTAGYQYFDTTLNKPIWYTGSKWVDATGTAV
jgi:hypothetical protein